GPGQLLRVAARRSVAGPLAPVVVGVQANHRYDRIRAAYRGRMAAFPSRRQPIVPRGPHGRRPAVVSGGLASAVLSRGLDRAGLPPPQGADLDPGGQAYLSDSFPADAGTGEAVGARPWPRPGVCDRHSDCPANRVAAAGPVRLFILGDERELAHVPS